MSVTAQPLLNGLENIEQYPRGYGKAFFDFNKLSLELISVELRVILKVSIGCLHPMRRLPEHYLRAYP